MQYCYVIDNEIIEGPRRLPNSWENISSLIKADAAFLLNLGWYPVEINHPKPIPDPDLDYTDPEGNPLPVPTLPGGTYSYDPKTEKLLSPVLTILADKVTSYIEVVAMSVPEIAIDFGKRKAIVGKNRRARYREESDGFAFDFLDSGLAEDKQTWKDARDAINADLPLPTS